MHHLMESKVEQLKTLYRSTYRKRQGPPRADDEEHNNWVKEIYEATKQRDHYEAAIVDPRRAPRFGEKKLENEIVRTHKEVLYISLITDIDIFVNSNAGLRSTAFLIQDLIVLETFTSCESRCIRGRGPLDTNMNNFIKV